MSAAEEDLQFLPGPLEDAPDFLPPAPGSGPSGATRVDDRTQAEASFHAAPETAPMAA